MDTRGYFMIGYYDATHDVEDTIKFASLAWTGPVSRWHSLPTTDLYRIATSAAT